MDRRRRARAGHAFDDEIAMSKSMTQGRALIEELKRRPMTYFQMINFGQGYSPHRRVVECLRDDEKLIKGKHASGCVTWAVRTIKPTRWTA